MGCRRGATTEARRMSGRSDPCGAAGGALGHLRARSADTGRPHRRSAKSLSPLPPSPHISGCLSLPPLYSLQHRARFQPPLLHPPWRCRARSGAGQGRLRRAPLPEALPHRNRTSEPGAHTGRGAESTGARSRGALPASRVSARLDPLPQRPAIRSQMVCFAAHCDLIITSSSPSLKPPRLCPLSLLNYDGIWEPLSFRAMNRSFLGQPPELRRRSLRSTCASSPRCRRNSTPSSIRTCGGKRRAPLVPVTQHGTSELTHRMFVGVDCDALFLLHCLSTVRSATAFDLRSRIPRPRVAFLCSAPDSHRGAQARNGQGSGMRCGPLPWGRWSRLPVSAALRHSVPARQRLLQQTDARLPESGCRLAK